MRTDLEILLFDLTSHPGGEGTARARPDHPTPPHVPSADPSAPRGKHPARTRRLISATIRPRQLLSSRRSVFTPSPAFTGTSVGATTWQWTPLCAHCHRREQHGEPPSLSSSSRCSQACVNAEPALGNCQVICAPGHLTRPGRTCDDGS